MKPISKSRVVDLVRFHYFEESMKRLQVGYEGCQRAALTASGIEVRQSMEHTIS